MNMPKQLSQMGILLTIILLLTSNHTLITRSAQATPLSPHFSNGMPPVFIHLQPATLAEIESVIQAVEAAGGRVLHSYPPTVIIATLPNDRLPALRRHSQIESIFTAAIPANYQQQWTEPANLAATVWNESHRSQPASTAQAGLSWDAPNLLPPDPPADVQAMLRQRERNLPPESGQE